MTFWDTFSAVLWALVFWRVIDLGTEYVISIYRRKKFDRLFDELVESWEELEAKKPVRKKAAAKKKA